MSDYFNGLFFRVFCLHLVEKTRKAQTHTPALIIKCDVLENVVLVLIYFISFYFILFQILLVKLFTVKAWSHCTLEMTNLKHTDSETLAFLQ